MHQDDVWTALETHRLGSGALGLEGADGVSDADQRARAEGAEDAVGGALVLQRGAVLTCKDLRCMTLLDGPKRWEISRLRSVDTIRTR